MDGFKRPIVPPQRPQMPPSGRPTQVAESPLQDTPRRFDDNATPTSLPPVDLSLAQLKSASMDVKKRKKRWLPFVIIVAVLVLLFGATYAWYTMQLQPVNPNDSTVQRVEIKEGSSFSYVADRLEDRGVIRNSLAFNVFASLQGKRDMIKAGTCNLTPQESADEVLTKITKGCHDFVAVTFYPGATINPSLYAKTKADEANKPFKDPSIRASLTAAGYSDTQIDQALAIRYDSPLFDGKPAKEGYEGYIFGETYYVNTGATAEEVLQTAFDQMYSIVQKHDLITKFKAQGLTLYQGITLASVVEKELDCEGKPSADRKERCYGYQQQIAEVFFNRLRADMTLGSDVTSIYASDKLGVTSSVDVDSPYNTRKHPGLPPGPIATPGELALKAVANPVKSDNLYFLAGDDGLIYFATDEKGHTANIKNHCQLLCGDL